MCPWTAKALIIAFSESKNGCGAFSLYLEEERNRGKKREPSLSSFFFLLQSHIKRKLRSNAFLCSEDWNNRGKQRVLFLLILSLTTYCSEIGEKGKLLKPGYNSFLCQLVDVTHIQKILVKKLFIFFKNHINFINSINFI